MSVDLTLIVMAHDETVMCGPTMRSADLAVEAARALGVTVQTIIGLVAPTEAATAYFEQPHFDHWEPRVLPEGDPERVRGAVVAECEGRRVTFVAAGDLVSENWLTEGSTALDEAGGQDEAGIARPELTVIFDGETEVVLNIEQGHSLFAPHFLYFGHYYDATCIAPREAYLELASAGRHTPGGQPFDQDAQFTVQTMAASWRHIVVKNTILFKRRHDLSPPSESNDRGSLVRALPAMAIDRIRDLGSP